MPRAGWGEEWLFYKNIVKMNTNLSFETDFIMYKKNGLNEKEYGFNGKSTIVKKVQENKIKPARNNVLAACRRC